MNHDAFDHPSELAFDQALQEDPSPDFTRHLQACPPCVAKLDALREELVVFRSSDEPNRAARIVRDKLAERSLGRRIRRWMWLPSLGVVAAAGFIVALRPTPEIRTKGGPRVTVFVHRVGGAPAAWDGAPLHEGDAVQLEVEQSDDRANQVAVYAVGAGCRVTLEHQQSLARSALIPASWTLRGVEGGERIYAVFSRRAIAPERLRTALAASGACDTLVAPDLQEPDYLARGVVLRSAIAQ